MEKKWIWAILVSAMLAAVPGCGKTAGTESTAVVTEVPTPTQKAAATPTKKATPTPTKKATPTPTKKAAATPKVTAAPTPTKKVTTTPTPTVKTTTTPKAAETPEPDQDACGSACCAYAYVGRKHEDGHGQGGLG